MANYNKVILAGNLTRDPKLSYTPSQTAVVEFGLAINRKWTAQDGSSREDVCFVDCQAFGKQAETINKFMTKGRPILVEGRLTYDTWTAQDGTKKSRLRVTVEIFQFLGSGPGGSDHGERGGAADRGSAQAPAPAPAQSPEGGRVREDEIPF